MTTILRTHAILNLHQLDPANEGLILRLLEVAEAEVAWGLVSEALTGLTPSFSPSTLAKIGFGLMCCQVFGAAETFLEGAIAGGVADASIKYNLAYCRTMNGKQQDSLTLISEIQEERELNLAEVTLKARALFDEKNLGKAIDLLKSQYLDGSFSAESLGLLALALYEEDTAPIEALDFAKKAIAIDAKALEAHLALGSIALSDNHFNQARTIFTLQISLLCPSVFFKLTGV